MENISGENLYWAVFIGIICLCVLVGSINGSIELSYPHLFETKWQKNERKIRQDFSEWYEAYKANPNAKFSEFMLKSRQTINALMENMRKN